MGIFTLLHYASLVTAGMSHTNTKPYYNLPYGVNLSVTNVKVIIDPATAKEGELVWITCQTKCPNFTEFHLYKNILSGPGNTTKLHINSKGTLIRVSKEDAGMYYCVVKGYEEQPSLATTLFVKYGPRNTSVSVSGVEAEGSSVTLTCSSDANPPVTLYTWFMKNGSEERILDTPTPTKDKIQIIIPRVNPGAVIQYYCEAKHELGTQRSASLDLNPGGSFPVASVVGGGGVVAVLAVVASVLVYHTVKRKSKPGRPMSKQEEMRENELASD
uniref:Ig-like domain-containing protein n=1 Tax=Esox lucius TaxID=8010 RepID=A0A6Q2YJU9_ESOLU